MPTRISFVDDHTICRQAYRVLFERHAEFEIVGEAHDSRSAIEMVAAKKPNVVTLDIGLPGKSGLATVGDLLAAHPKCQVLMLTMYDESEYVVQALANGATGYALKQQPEHEICQAIRTVAGGKRYLAPGLSRDLIEESKQRALEPDTSRGPITSLTAREREIFDLIVQNLSNQAIADRLLISVKTVETHRNSINRKLAVHSPAELIRFAAFHKLLR